MGGPRNIGAPLAEPAEMLEADDQSRALQFFMLEFLNIQNLQY